MLSGIRQSQKDTSCDFRLEEVARVVSPQGWKVESWVPGAREGVGSESLMGTVSFWEDERFWRWRVVMVCSNVTIIHATELSTSNA